MQRTSPGGLPQPRSASRSAGGGLSSLAGLVLLAGLVGCAPDSRTVVVISVDGLMPTVQAIRATAMLNGQTDVELFTSGLGQFGMRLPAGASGTLSLVLDALRADQCAIARGSGSVAVGSQSRAEVSISLAALAAPSCATGDMGGATIPVSVAKTFNAANPANGTITSTPAGISCGATCSAEFAPGTQVALSVLADYRSLFTGWSGACTAPGSACVLTANSAQQATAGFVATTCTLDRICEKLPTPLPAIKFRAVWGTSASNIWAVGNSGKIMHWDGALFTAVDSGTTSDLLSIWGASASDFWIGAANGLLLRWNGTTFTQRQGGSTQGVSGIWGSGPKDVWFLDGSTTLQRWDGTTFTAYVTGSGSSLSALWGSSANDLWVVTLTGGILHWQGTGFATVTSGTTQLLTSIWGSGPSDVWAASAPNGSGFAVIIHYKVGPTQTDLETFRSRVPDNYR